MDNPTTLPDDVREAIERLIQRRRAQGNVSTGRVIRELRETFPHLDCNARDLEIAIATNAIRSGLQVQLEAEPRNDLGRA